VFIATARERIVGFYSSGPKIKPADMAVEALFRSYTSAPVMVIIDVRPECEEVPTTAYVAVDRAVEVGFVISGGAGCLCLCVSVLDIAW
jgi:26S proteasome regulatory subunit N8